MLGLSKRESALYERIIEMQAAEIRLLQHHLGMLPAPIAPIAPTALNALAIPASLAPPMEALWMNEDEEDISHATRTSQIGAAEASTLLEQMGFSANTVEDYTFKT